MAFKGGDPDDLAAAQQALNAHAQSYEDAARGVGERLLSLAVDCGSDVVSEAVASFRQIYAGGLGFVGADLRTLAQVTQEQARQLREAAN